MFERLPIYLALALLRFFSLLPMSWVIRLGSCLGFLSYLFLKSRRNVGMVNLTLCFPTMTYKEKKNLLKSHFIELMISSLCYGLIFYASAEKIKKRVLVYGLENYNKYRGKKPIVLLAPHFLGLDIGANRLTLETPGYSVYAQQKNQYLTRRIKEARLRFIKSTGGEIFSRQQGLRTIIRKMKQTLIPFYYLPDQDMDERDSVYVPFFAHPHCITLATLPKLIKLTNAVVIPMATYREGERYVVELAKAWENYPEGDEIQDVSYMNHFIEQMIMRQPAQYLWLHKRFKTQPNSKRGKLYEKC